MPSRSHRAAERPPEVRRVDCCLARRVVPTRGYRPCRFKGKVAWGFRYNGRGPAAFAPALQTKKGRPEASASTPASPITTLLSHERT